MAKKLIVKKKRARGGIGRVAVLVPTGEVHPELGVKILKMVKIQPDPNGYKMTLRANSKLLRESLYLLEDDLGPCDGHGGGMGGEDIDWPFGKTKEYIDELGISRHGRTLTFFVMRHFEDINKDGIDLPLSSLPKKLKNGLIKVLQKHCNGGLPKELLAKNKTEK